MEMMRLLLLKLFKSILYNTGAVLTGKEATANAHNYEPY